jgi:hypothetical protein
VKVVAGRNGIAISQWSNRLKVMRAVGSDWLYR